MIIENKKPNLECASENGSKLEIAQLEIVKLRRVIQSQAQQLSDLAAQVNAKKPFVQPAVPSIIPAEAVKDAEARADLACSITGLYLRERMSSALNSL